MKQFLVMLALLSIGVVTGLWIGKPMSPGSVQESAIEHARKHQDPNYVCPMHSQIVSDQPGTCPICGMDLVEIKSTKGETGESDEAHPVVRIPSTVINNMGVRVAQVERKTLVRTIETPGLVQRLAPEKFIRYTAPAKGRVSKLYFTPGAWVKEGAPLVDIELDDLVEVQKKYLELLAEKQAEEGNIAARTATSNNGVMHAADALAGTQSEMPSDKRAGNTAELAPQAKAESRLAARADDTARNTDRGQGNEQATGEATNQDANPVRDLDKELARVRRLLQLAGMTQARIAELEKTGKTSPVITLYASHEGLIQKLMVKEGEHVGPRRMLFMLGGLARAIVLANAFQRDATWVRQGQDVDIFLPHDSSKPVKGKVTKGAVSININSQNIGIELSFVAPASQVKSGMYVVGHIYGQVKKDVLVIPRDAVIYTRNEKRVIVALGEGRFKPVIIETGISNDTEVEVTRGLEEGDTIVVSAQFFIDSESSLQASFRRIAPVE